MKTLLALCLVFIATSSYAANMRFLTESVLSEFEKEELLDFKAFVRGALDTLKDQEVVTWKAKNSPLSGKLKTKFTYQSNGTTCRRSLFLIANKTKKEPYKFEICKNGDRWEIQDTPARHFKKQDWEIMRSSIVQALDHSDPGTPFSWHNKHSGHSGSQVVVATETTEQGLCRKIAITIFGGQGKSSNGVYAFCKTPDKKGPTGIWERQMGTEIFD